MWGHWGLHEGQDNDAESGENALEQRWSTPCPGRLPLACTKGNTSGQQGTDTTGLGSVDFIFRQGDSDHSLVEVVQVANTPRSPSTREGLAKVDTTSHAR